MVTVLVTSRESLRIQGEHEFPVPPLTAPDTRQSLSPAAVSQYEAVALFVDRAVFAKMFVRDGPARE